ncbi:MAG: hypothetical protein ACRDO2_01530 [Nocardioidaceae bacterium]
MLATSISKTPEAQSSAEAKVLPAQPTGRDREVVHHERPHLSKVVMGLLDARLSGVDFFDTEVGQELLRLYLFHRHGPRDTAKKDDAGAS